MSLVSNLIWFFGVGGVSVAVLAYYFQDYLLYFPGIPPGARTMFLDPAAFMLKNFMREVMLPTHDGQLLQLWLFLRPPEEPGSRDAATIVFFHGNAGNISHRLDFARIMFHMLRVNFVLVEYRGFGRSTGSPAEKPIQHDAKTVLSYLRSLDEINNDRLYVMGRSLGGAVALHVAVEMEAMQTPLAGVIVENTFTSIPAMIPHVMPLLSALPEFLITNKWRNEDVVRRLRAPLLVISGARDSMVPPYMAKSIANNAIKSQRSVIRIFPNGEHMDTWLQPGYIRTIAQWINEVENPSLSSSDLQPTELVVTE